MMSSRVHISSSRNRRVDGKEYLPLIDPDPPQLSRFSHELEEIELSSVYSNYGPMNKTLEQELIDRIFGEGSCVAVCNATIGLMLAIREAIGDNRPSQCRYALMPSFTFAATAQAALWCGLTPVLCDIDPHTWMMCPQRTEHLLRKFGREVAVIVPYATFGNNLDLEAFECLSTRYGVPVVVDAAASLGSRDTRGHAFGRGFSSAVVFSMHATKAFSVGEGGLIYSSDRARVERLRSMGSFGFAEGRQAMSIGLNSKLSEVAALTARLQLRRHENQHKKAQALAKIYKKSLGPAFGFQVSLGTQQALSFQPVLLPAEIACFRDAMIQSLEADGIGVGKYFSPHLVEQPYIREHAQFGELPVTDDIASRILSLPLTTKMTEEDVHRVVDVLKTTCSRLAEASRRSGQHRSTLHRPAA